MYTVSQVSEIVIPEGGLRCTVRGLFFYRIAHLDTESTTPPCYIADSSDSGPIIGLPQAIGETVIDDDETFGMLVGGEFAYFGVNAHLSGLVVSQGSGVKEFAEVNNLILEMDGRSQEFATSR